MKLALKNGIFYKIMVIKMKIKGVIEDLKFKKIIIKNDNSRNIFRNFSGTVVDSVGSVHF